MSIPKHVKVVEVGPRDGLQNESGLISAADKIAYIDTLGMMGEKFVEISLGSMDSPAMARGSVIEGVDPIPMHVLIRKMNLLADKVSKMTDRLNPLLKTVNDVVGGNKEEISKTVGNLNEVSANLRDMTADLKFHPWRLLRKGS